MNVAQIQFEMQDKIARQFSAAPNKRGSEQPETSGIRMPNTRTLAERRYKGQRGRRRARSGYQAL